MAENTENTENTQTEATSVEAQESAGIKKKIQIDLEVDTNTVDSSQNPFKWIIHLARAVDAWRIFPRIFITTYIYLLYTVVVWYMNLADPNGTIVSLVLVVGAGAAWFGLYAGTSKKKD